MSPKTLVTTFDNVHEAERAVQKLQDDGFAPEGLGWVEHDDHGREIAHGSLSEKRNSAKLSRVRRKRVREDGGDEVPYDDIVKGHELDDGRVVIVERAELDALAPGRSKVIEIEDFVPLAQVDPVVFDRSYYLGPAGDRSGGKPYELLRQVCPCAECQKARS